MYEDRTFDALMGRCLGRVPNGLDMREGSVIYDALAPACAELAALYTELGTMLDRAFPDTATGDDLDRLALMRSLKRAEATFAVRKGLFTGTSGAGFDVPLGARFSGGDLNFTATKRLAAGQYELTAETPGSGGNRYFGTLFPIDHLEGLASATLTDVLVPGDDAEDDDGLRGRYFASLNGLAFGGNLADYREKVGSLDGVGGVKVFPAWSGGGTVKLVLVDSLWKVPSDKLVQEVQNAVDPVGHQGEGVGFAPIGHVVTAAPAEGVPVTVSLALTLGGNITWEGVKPEVTAAIQKYFDGLIQGWADADGLTVRLSQIETRVLAVAGVEDIQGTALNGVASNLLLGGEQVPVLEAVTHGAA